MKTKDKCKLIETKTPLETHLTGQHVNININFCFLLMTKYDQKKDFIFVTLAVAIFPGWKFENFMRKAGRNFISR